MTRVRACVDACAKRTHLPATGKCHEEYYYSATPHRLPFLINLAPKHISYQDNPFVLITPTEVFDLRDEPCDATNFMRRRDDDNDDDGDLDDNITIIMHE